MLNVFPIVVRCIRLFFLFIILFYLSTCSYYGSFSFVSAQCVSFFYSSNCSPFIGKFLFHLHIHWIGFFSIFPIALYMFLFHLYIHYLFRFLFARLILRTHKKLNVEPSSKFINKTILGCLKKLPQYVLGGN